MILNTWQCNVCRKTFLRNEMLRETHPFVPEDVIYGCPHCRQCEEGFSKICDEPECMAVVSCGWPSEQGYRQTCRKHWMQV